MTQNNCCETIQPIDGAIFDFCHVAGYGFSLELQYLNDQGAPIPLPAGTTPSGAVKESIDSTNVEIDLTPFLTVTDAALGKITFAMSDADTAFYQQIGFKGIFQISFNSGGNKTILINPKSTFVLQKDAQNGPIIPSGSAPSVEGSFSWSTGDNLTINGPTFWDFDENLPQTLLLAEGFEVNPLDTTEVICKIAGRYAIMPGGGHSNTTTNQNYSINFFTVNGVTVASGTITMAPQGGTALSFQKIHELFVGDVIKVSSNDFPIGLPSGSHGSSLFDRSLIIIKG